MITTLLIDEHNQVKDLFTRAKESPEPELIAEIGAKLRLHALAEEHVVYPRFRLMDKRAIDHGEKEHDKIEAALGKLEGAAPGDLEDCLAKLEEVVNHHVEEEETKIFPQAEEEISHEELNGLAEQYKQFKASY